MNRKAPVLFLCLAAAALLLLAHLPSGKEGVPVSYVPMEPVTILVATDPHFLAPSLTDGGEAFLGVVTHADGKYMQRIGEITDALFALTSSLSAALFQKKERLTDAEIHNVCAYALRFPPDFATTLFSDLNRDESIRLKLMSSRLFGDWLKRNKDFIVS